MVESTWTGVLCMVCKLREWIADGVFYGKEDLCKMSIWHLNPMFDIIFLALSAQKVVSCMLVNGNWGGKCFR